MQFLIETNFTTFHFIAILATTISVFLIFYSKSLVKSSYAHKNYSLYEGFESKKMITVFSFLGLLTALLLSFLFFSFNSKQWKRPAIGSSVGKRDEIVVADRKTVPATPTTKELGTSEGKENSKKKEEDDAKRLEEARRLATEKEALAKEAARLILAATILNALTAKPPTVQKGDAYTYRSSDPNSGTEIITEKTVLSVGDEIILSTKDLRSRKAKPRTLYFDRGWNLIRTRDADGVGGYDYSPPLKYYDFPLYPGKTWRQTSTETDVKTSRVRTHELTGTVKGWEEMPVGTEKFMALRVDVETTLTNPNRTTENATDVSWYVPELRKNIRTEISSNKEGRVEKRIIQLISYSKALVK